MRAEKLASAKIDFVDCGTSGGVFGLERGFCLMIGGPEGAVERLDPIFRALAPGLDAAGERTPGRTGDPAPEEMGYLHCGPAGAGHFVKMVHNGIEYALMASYAEGLNILHHANVGNIKQTRRRGDGAAARSERVRVRLRRRQGRPRCGAAAAWSRRGCSISPPRRCRSRRRSKDSPAGSAIRARAGGRSSAAIDEGVPAPVIATALFDRFTSQQEADFANKLLSAMRKQFGGHAEKPPAGE